MPDHCIYKSIIKFILNTCFHQIKHWLLNRKSIWITNKFWQMHKKCIGNQHFTVQQIQILLSICHYLFNVNLSFHLNAKIKEPTKSILTTPTNRSHSIRPIFSHICFSIKCCRGDVVCGIPNICLKVIQKLNPIKKLEEKTMNLANHKKIKW